MVDLDFDGLNAQLLPNASAHLTSWLPGGRMVGPEYVCGDLFGGPGDSCKVNLNTGKWADFAAGEQGGDLVSLYARINNIKNGEAAKRLADQINFQVRPQADPPSKASATQDVKLGRPPGGAAPSMSHAKFGQPSGFWCYEDAEGPLFWVARYETAEGKQFCPWSWSQSARKWVAKGWPAPRPLFGLKELLAAPEKPVLICEGEKATEAARKLVNGLYAVVSWANGAKAMDKADWKPIHGRKVLLWPDADDPGSAAMRKLGDILAPVCPEVKIIDANDKKDGWDAADALALGWDYKQFFAWAKPRAKLIPKVAQPVDKAEIVPVEPLHSRTLNLNVSITENDIPADAQDAESLWTEIGLARPHSGAPFANMDNVRRCLESYAPLKKLVWFDEFHQRCFTTGPSGPRPWSDIDYLNLCTLFQRNLGLSKMSLDAVRHGVEAAGRMDTRNEPRDWMKTLTWDGQSRIKEFLADNFGVAYSEYTDAASRNFWVGMVARVFEPGCKLDNMLVLEGPQGAYKSTALEIVGGRWYTQMTADVQSKDFFLGLRGKLLVEIAEFDSFYRADITRIKQVVSSRTDTYRSPYAMLSDDHPRMSIFAATTNETMWSKDQTGARRFWPILCKEINLDRIRRDRDQLFAEAVSEYQKNPTWWIMPKDDTAREQESRRMADEWEGAIYEWTAGRLSCTIREIAKDCLGIGLDKLDRMTQMRVGIILKKHGWITESEGQAQLRTWTRSKSHEIAPA